NVLAAATGWLLGVYSLFHLHSIWLRAFGAWKAHSLTVIVLLLSSIGVYLGRFLRWNTWDLLTKPIPIFVDSIQALFDKDALLFITSFALVTGFLYYIL